MSFNSRSMRAALLAATAWMAPAALMPAMAETVTTINGVDIDSSVVDTYYESRYQKPVAEATADERAQVLQELTDIYLLTTQPRANEFARDPRIQAQAELQYRGTLAQAVAADYISSHPATEAEIQAAYEDELASASDQQYKARHILVETQASATELIEELDEGADFQELAREHSTGPSGPNGGDLGWFSPEHMVPSFSQAVVALEDGAYTEVPVQTQFGWHVILREDSRAAEAPTLESMREQLRQRVEQTKFQDYIQSLRDANAEAG